MFKFTNILAATALVAQEAAALTTVNNQLNLTQVQSKLSSSNANVQQIQQTQVFAQVATATDEETKKATCVTNMTATFWAADSTATTPLSQFNSYVGTICPGLGLSVPNGVITAACFHSGYFLLMKLRPLAEAGLLDAAAEIANSVHTQEFNIYVDDFCSNYEAVIPERTAFIKEIYEIVDADSFNTVCTERMAQQVKLNSWFDPIDPLSSITQREICDLHFKLFASLREKQRKSVAEFISFSYLASLDLFLNAQAQEDFENCVNKEVVAAPAQWVTNFTTTHAAFKNWDITLMTEQSAVAGSAVTEGCAESISCMATGSCPNCEGCSIAISRVYNKYEEYLNNLFAETFKAASEGMFNKLHEANLSLEQSTN